MEHQLLIGKFTLESLTSGLYVSPLDLYREYVQNAADSIDEALEQGILKKGEEKISITVSESERIIKISDNGTGVGANDIYSNLIDIGNSKKRHSNSRGFRGIGRLSGLQDEMTMKKIVPIKNCLVSSRNGLMKCQGRYVTDLTKEV